MRLLLAAALVLGSAPLPAQEQAEDLESMDILTCETECTARDPASIFTQSPLQHDTHLCVSQIEDQRFIVEAKCKYEGRGEERQVVWEVVDIIRPVGGHEPFSGTQHPADERTDFLSKRDEDGDCHKKFRHRRGWAYCRAPVPKVPERCPCGMIREALDRTEKKLEELIPDWQALVDWCKGERTRRKPCTETEPAYRRCMLDTLKFALAYKKFCRSCPDSCRVKFEAGKLVIDGYHSRAMKTPELPREELVYDPPPPPVQIAVLMDTSSSMAGLWFQTRSQLMKSLRDTFGEGMPFEVSLYEYGNSWLKRKDHYVRQILPFVDSPGAVDAELKRVRIKGGGEWAGAAIARAARELPWDPNPETYKAIVVAGNESFKQGPVPYDQAIRQARSRGIIVHTIFCGTEAEGAGLGWEEGADLGRGGYAAIQQDLDPDKITGSSFGGALSRILRLEGKP